MSLTIPPGTVPYGTQGQLLSPQICWWRGQPAVDLALPCEIDWNNSGGTGVVAPAVELNIGAQLTSQNFGVLQALYVNNVECGVDVTFIFPDTQFRLDVPAGGAGIFPVLSLAGNFFIQATGAGSADTTNFTCLNFYPPPVSIQKPAFANNASAAGLALTAGTTQLIANTVNGTLEGLNLSYFLANNGLANVQLELKDGTGKVLFNGFLGSTAATNATTGLLIDQSAMNLQFQRGLAITVTPSVATGGLFNINLFYH